MTDALMEGLRDRKIILPAPGTLERAGATGRARARRLDCGSADRAADARPGGAHRCPALAGCTLSCEASRQNATSPATETRTDLQSP
ncbi:DUF4158 domain-containing protein [Bosea sp. F3-2]|nr:DUF4158 domain-containing protein [Bosea sp. F3-2]